MTELQARKEGLQFTGHYRSSFEVDIVKKIAKEERAKYKGYGVRIVMVKGAFGTSLYANDKYFSLKEKDRIKEKIDSYEENVEAIKKEYERKLAELKEAHLNDLSKLNKLQMELSK